MHSRYILRGFVPRPPPSPPRPSPLKAAIVAGVGTSNRPPCLNRHRPDYGRMDPVASRNPATPAKMRTDRADTQKHMQRAPARLTHLRGMSAARELAP